MLRTLTALEVPLRMDATKTIRIGKTRLILSQLDACVTRCS